MSSSGSVPMATNSTHSHQVQTHSGLSDHDSGPSISTNSANNNRVESPPRNSEQNLWDMGNSNSGHVCHIPQHASSPVFDSDFGATSTGDRCSVTMYPVSIVSPTQQSHSTTKDHPRGQGNSNSPLVAISTVVSTSTTSVCGPPSHYSVPEVPTVTTRVFLRWEVVPSARLKALMQHYYTAGGFACSKP